jgi:two-component system cell cycle sensor histidine kinase/response regulator CckA
MSDPIEPAPPASKGTILVAEDEPAILELTTKLCQSLGYQVLSATHPAKLLDLAQAHRGKVAVLLTDMVMPGMNGRVLAESVRALHPEAKLLFMSGYPVGLVEADGEKAQGVHFLSKPFTRRALEEKLVEMLA